MGESEIEDMLHRLDRLTLDEARMTGTETLQVVHGLMSNLKLVIGGMNNLKLVIGGMQLSLHQLLIAHRAVRIDGTTFMQDIWQALGMLDMRSISTRLTVDTSHNPRGDKPDKQDETRAITPANRSIIRTDFAS